jgi:hypothetical protein
MPITDHETRVLSALLKKNEGTATNDDLIIIDLYMASINEPTPTPTTHNMVGAVVMKDFEAGRFKGHVIDHDEFGFFVEYEDGDTEHLSADEVEEILYTPEPINLCDKIEWIETSGNRAQSFAKVCREIVNDRPHMAHALADIYWEMGNYDIAYDGEFDVHDISPVLWRHLGNSDPEKLHWAKRVLEVLVSRS